MFQFHYGTIGRGDVAREVYQMEKFQFHYGTIGRICFQFQAVQLQSFNSTMVRLVDQKPHSP